MSQLREVAGASHGEGWARGLLAGLSSHRYALGSSSRDRLAWISTLPSIVRALLAADGQHGATAAGLLLANRWTWLATELEAGARDQQPSRQAKALEELGPPLGAWLTASALAGLGRLQAAAIELLIAGRTPTLLPCLLALLRAASREPIAEIGPALEAVATHVAQTLRAQLSRPERAADDWSVALPAGCACELCTRLGSFLADPTHRRLEWPLAKDRRQHLHGRIDLAELPLRHTTIRTGSPHVLVLEKLPALHQRETEARRAWREALAFVEERWP